MNGRGRKLSLGACEENRRGMERAGLCGARARSIRHRGRGWETAACVIVQQPRRPQTQAQRKGRRNPASSDCMGGTRKGDKLVVMSTHHF